MNWTVSKEDHEKLMAIIARVELKLGPIDYPKRDMLMDLTACHLKACPLDLNDMLRASDFDLMHDVLGIRQYINRRTMALTNYFVPRMAARKEDRE